MGISSGLSSWWSEKRSTIKEDLIAGLIVAIVAMPLAIGFAIASNVPPAMGIVTAIIGGFFAALFGGSEYQVSGPTGAMVVVVLSVVAKYGVSGLIIATFLAGIILLIIAALKLGKIIEYIPSPVIVGFTAGIAVIIFTGQLNNFFGINPVYPTGAGFLQKNLISLASAVQANLGAVILALLTVAILIITPRINKRIPGSIIAVVVTTALAVGFASFFHVKTVGDIGKIPSTLPMPAIPGLDWSIVVALLPAALTIAALAAIESLLSAVVADGMTDTKHQPNKELAGQGIANICSALFGGMPVTGAIARTATNIRNGARSRIAGISHAVFLLIFVIALAGLATLIPIATLAGILMFVAFNMVEWDRIRMIFRTPLSDIAVMVTTFLLTIFVDLTVAIEVGLVLAAILFMKRMSDLYNIESVEHKTQNAAAAQFKHPKISIYTMNGPLFFGAASRLDQQLATTPGGHKPIKILRMRDVPVIDATGLAFIEGTWKKHKKMNGHVFFVGCSPSVMKVIRESGIEQEIRKEHFVSTTRQAIILALRHAHRMQGEQETVLPEELAPYEKTLSVFDAEEQEQGTAALHDVDPVEEMLDSVGVTTVHKIGKKSVRKARELGEESVDTVKRIGKRTVRGVRNVTKKKKW